MIPALEHDIAAANALKPGEEHAGLELDDALKPNHAFSLKLDCKYNAVLHGAGVFR